MTTTDQPLAKSSQLEELRRKLHINVSAPERFLSVLAGGVVVRAALRRRSFGRVLLGLLGGTLIYRGATGHSGIYEILGIYSRPLPTAAGIPENRGIKVVRSVTVRRPRAELYNFWRNLENLPRILQHIQSVEILDERRSRWTVNAPAGQTVTWIAEIINERAGEMLTWESLPGAPIRNSGSVWFEDAPGGATTIKASMEFERPAGAVGALFAELLGESPEDALSQDLQRFKRMAESELTMAAGEKRPQSF